MLSWEQTFATRAAAKGRVRKYPLSSIGEDPFSLGDREVLPGVLANAAFVLEVAEDAIEVVGFDLHPFGNIGGTDAGRFLDQSTAWSARPPRCRRRLGTGFAVALLPRGRPGFPLVALPPSASRTRSRRCRSSFGSSSRLLISLALHRRSRSTYPPPLQVSFLCLSDRPSSLEPSARRRGALWVHGRSGPPIRG